jgi:putative phosphoesterase
MVIGVISDTHHRKLPGECVARLADVDAIVHGGDFTAREDLEALQQIGPPVHAVRGNGDDPWLVAKLPLMCTVEFEGVQIGLVHDAGPAKGRLNRLHKRFPDARAVIFGHSHIPLHESFGDFEIFNPGSPTDRRRQPRHSMGVATIEDGKISFDLLLL